MTPGEFNELVDGYKWRMEEANWGRAWLGSMLMTAVTRKVVKPADLMPKAETKPQAPAPTTREKVLADLRALDAELNEGLAKKRAQPLGLP